MDDLLVIAPCSQGKVWDKSPDHGPTPARDAYTGSPFKVNRQYAEHFGAEWIILSAKYGFIGPDSEGKNPRQWAVAGERTVEDTAVTR